MLCLRRPNNPFCRLCFAMLFFHPQIFFQLGLDFLAGYSGPKYEWAITPVLAKRLVSNCDTNLLMTISTFEETAVLSVAQSRCDLRRHCLHKSLVDHRFTTDRCGNNGDRTSRKFWRQRYSEQKRLKTNWNYYKNHQKPVGKDEVTSSNLVSSSKMCWWKMQRWKHRTKVRCFHI